MSTPIVVSKHPDSVLDLTINYANQLTAGEVLVSATAGVVGSGSITVDPSPPVASPFVTVRVSGGTDGVTDSFLVLADTNTGEILDAVIYVSVSIGVLTPISYSTPERLAARIGPKIYAQLTAETGNIPDDLIAQGWLEAATQEINIRIGNRYVIPVTAPAHQVSLLAGLEEQIAYWFGWVYRGIGDSESAAAAAKVGYDAAMKLLDAIAAGDVDLTGVLVRPPEVTATGGSANWTSNPVVYSSHNFRSF